MPETPHIFPDDLLLSELATRGKERRWWIAYTRPRQEKTLARELARQEIPFYLPLIARRTSRRGRKEFSELPLYPGYVFVFADDAERSRCAASAPVLHMLSVGDQASLHNDLSGIHRLINSGAPVTIESKLQPGRRVRIVSGPLAGIEGIIVRKEAETRIVVAMHFLQQGASVVVDAAALESLEEAPAPLEEQLAGDTVISRPAVYIAWDPEVIGGERYVRLVNALGDFVRSRGGDGVKLIRSHGFGIAATSGAYHE